MADYPCSLRPNREEVTLPQVDAGTSRRWSRDPAVASRGAAYQGACPQYVFYRTAATDIDGDSIISKVTTPSSVSSLFGAKSEPFKEAIRGRALVMFGDGIATRPPEAQPHVRAGQRNSTGSRLYNPSMHGCQALHQVCTMTALSYWHSRGQTEAPREATTDKRRDASSRARQETERGNSEKE